MYLQIRLAVLLLSFLFFGCEKATPPPAVKFVAPAPTEDAIAAFMEAATQGQTALVIEALNAGMPVNQLNAEDNTALILTSYEGHVETMKALIKAGADVNHPGVQGNTALMLACGPKPDGFPIAVELLIESGADLNTVDRNKGDSALMYAATEGLAPICSLLIKAGADPTLKNIDGDTAADIARQKGFTGLADRLQALVDSN